MAISTEQHTAGQVKQRRGRPLEQVVAGWDGAAEDMERLIAGHPLPIASVYDVLFHKADIWVALGAGQPPMQRGPRR